MIDHSLTDRFAEYSLKNIVHPFIHTQFSRSEIQANLEREIEGDLLKGSDDEFAQGFRKLCPVEAATPEDYKLRHLKIESGFEVLAGIRFRGLDLNRPFVAILHRTRSFESETHLRRMMAALQEAFAVFSPKAVLYYQASHNVPFTFGEEVRDKCILMGALTDVASVPIVTDITLVQAADLDFYERYVNEYAIVSKSSPDYLRAETAEHEEDMERYVKHDITYKVYIKGEFAGVFIVKEQTFLGAKGYYVIENLLFDKFRGKGYGPTVQHFVAEELLTRGAKVMFGSIYPSNLPSYRAALRSGRIDIGANYMVPIQ